MILTFLLVLTTFLGHGCGQEDPCSETVYSTLPYLAKRSPSFEEDSVPLCDRYLSEKWYRADSLQMPTTAPELGYCGTLYPYWMNGAIPGNGMMSTVVVCQVGFESNCVRSHSIRVKNCGLYAVYELTPLSTCNSAYCFEARNTCVDGVPTALSVAFHNVSWKSYPSDTAKNRKHQPSVNLICNFFPLSNKDDIFYDISWYIDRTEVLKNQTVRPDERMNAILSASQILRANKKAGSMVQCVVGAKVNAVARPCNVSSSPLFFAGIKVWPTTLYIERGQSQNIYLEPTIPYADQILVLRNEEKDAPQLAITIDLLNDSSISCRNEDDKSITRCGTRIPSYTYSERIKYVTGEWRRTYPITIYNKDDGDFEIIDKHMTLRLKSGGTHGDPTSPSKILEENFLSDVQVFITDSNSTWKGKTCKSSSDPNFKTFDSVSYSFQLLGTFILYRNDAYNQEVQEKHYPCHPSATCNCAAAVRSGRDVFTIDICNGQTIINFPICDDNVLKVIKESDRVYKVILPTGTIVSIKIVTWNGFTFLNIEITASPSDLKNTRGLSGILDGDQLNEITARNNTQYPHYLHPPDAFFRSWMANDTENLLIESQTVYNGLTSISNTLARVCSCINATGNYDIICNYGSYKDCKFNIGKPFYCTLNSAGQRRRKRDLSYIKSKSLMEEISTFGEMETKIKRTKRQTKISFEEAENICLTEFEKSDPYLTCQKYVPNLGNSSLMDCISDLTITGDLNFTTIHIDATLELCSTFIVLNSSLRHTEPKVTYEILTLCPSNCTGNGVCNEGNCTCNSGYAGSDCSFDLFGPPTITHISDFGVCDKSEEDCDDITLYGKYFLEHMHTVCHTNRHSIAKNGSVVSSEYFQRSLEERTMFEGFCPLEYSTTPTWVTYFTFNISNDGKRFTEDFKVYTYQSLCQEFHNVSGNISFTFKDGYCFIDGQCIVDGKSNSNNLCDICNVTHDIYSWTYNKGHCYINERCIVGGEVDESNVCSVCDPEIDKTAWSLNPGFCFIDDICYFDGETRQNNDCEICNITENRHQWTFVEDGYCLINGDCVRNGDHDTLLECNICNPALNNADWSFDSAGYCLINESCVRNGNHDTLKECNICNPALNNTDWSLDTDFCYISELCVKNGTVNETNSCAICNVTANSKMWSLREGCPTTSTEPPPTTTATRKTIEPSTTEQATTEPATQMSTTRETSTTLIALETKTEPRITTATTKPTSTSMTASTTITTKPTLIEIVTTESTTKPTTTTKSTTIEESTTTVIESTSISLSTTGKSNCVNNIFTDVTVSYHNVSWITNSHTEGSTTYTKHEPTVNMKCSFSLSSDPGAFYHIIWYIDGTAVLNQTLSETSIDQALLPLDHVKKNGSKLQCFVGATWRQQDEPCEFHQSSMFFTGLKVSNKEVTIPRKGKATVGIQQNIPYVTLTQKVNETLQSMSSMKVQSMSSQYPAYCMENIKFDQCILPIHAYSYDERHKYDTEDWRVTYNLTIHHIDTEGYSIDSSATVILKITDGEYEHHFANISIKITEENSVWKGRICGSKTDPHLYSFDGKSYENHMDGDYILYRNELYNQEIQTRHQQCHSSYTFPQCTCAVAVRSGRDIFQINICDNNQTVDFQLCDDMVIKVYRLGDKVFKVLLPTGTSVTVSLVEWPDEGHWHIDLDIYPSSLDVNNTAGLCGTLDGKVENDFTRRSGKIDNITLEYPNDFSESWLTPERENLFTSTQSTLQSLESVSNSFDQICTCTNGEQLCLYKAHIPCVSSSAKEFRCTESFLRSSRRKREVLERHPTMDLYGSQSPNRMKRQITNQRKSQEEAETICKSAFEKSKSYETCQHHVCDLNNASLTNCVMDIVMTGDDNITSIHIEAALKQCVEFVGLNTTLQTAEPQIAHQLKNLCPQNCSKHGMCDEGSCTCDDGFGGSDCSFDVRSPPVITSLIPNVVCDRSFQNCTEVVVEGRYFLEGVNNTCFITRQTLRQDGKTNAASQLQQPLNDRSLFLGTCPLIYDSEETWVTKFSISISNDNLQFTDSFHLYTYRSDCQQLSQANGDVSFTLKDDYCFIKTMCINKGSRNPDNSCETCDPAQHKHDWSLRQDCMTSTKAPSTTNNDIILIVSIVPIVVILFAIIIGCAIYYCQRGEQAVKDHGDKTTEYRKDFTRPTWMRYFGNETGKKDFRSFQFPRRIRDSGNSYSKRSGRDYLF